MSTNAQHRIRDLAPTAAANRRQVAAIEFATGKQFEGRKRLLAWRDRCRELRELAGRIKQHTVDHLADYLERFADQAESRGVHMHWAADAAEARRIVVEIARRRGCTCAIKGKSMTSEEVRLNPALEAAGVRVIETDLAEIIIQLDQGEPSHLVTPAAHYDRHAVSRVFTEKLGIEPTDDPRALTQASREYLRREFPKADLGVCGANFAVAEDGTVCVITNEGNGRYVTALPKTLVVLMGAEKLVPRRRDLSLFLELLARSATGQELSVYTNMIRGPRRPGEQDGPEEMHVVVLDNGRSRILKSDYRQVLRCLRCGACLNACPVYRKLGGGHPYQSPYSGPIGALVTPLLWGLEHYPEHAQASSLCGACQEACPVAIPIPQLLIRMRAELHRRGLTRLSERLTLKGAAWVLGKPWRYRLFGRLLRWWLAGRTDGGWVDRLPGDLAGWTDVKDFPAPAPKTFQQLWRERSKP